MWSVCLECKYYTQHYVKNADGVSYRKTAFGVCKLKRIRMVHDDKKACENFCNRLPMNLTSLL